MSAGVALTAMLLVVQACASTSEDEIAFPAADARPATTLTVQNNNWSDITVYVQAPGSVSRRRLGTVMSGRREEYELPRNLIARAGRIQLVADPIGSFTPYTTTPIPVAAGQTVLWSVENYIDHSSWSVR